jgi:antitoxin (DNA-binding transcriptional repressor) of toxin-antitoxin stability system
VTKIKKVSVSELKVHALQLIESVKSSNTEIEVYKHGKLVARITPAAEEPRKSILGCAVGLGRIVGDPDSIMDPIDVEWDA